MLSTDEIKKKAAVYAADFIQNEMIVGLGTGSTVYWLILELGKRVKEGLSITIVPTSKKTQMLATELNMPIVDLNSIDKISLTIDGADEVDPQLHLIKGGGGALLQEKIVAAASEQFIVVVDNSKIVQQLGKFPLPVEVIPFGYKQVLQKILAMGCEDVILRKRNDQSFVTDHGHYILDCFFEKIRDAFALHTALHNIPGVVETGLFINMVNKVIVAFPDGRIETLERSFDDRVI
ncbi:MAG TPA: ribose-5-phosphate isomerase RpiA [Chitinophagaceae bacterium]|jgi:ribose 5-phosphate isomerase A